MGQLPTILESLRGLEFPVIVAGTDGRVIWISPSAEAHLPFLLDWSGRNLGDALEIGAEGFAGWLDSTRNGTQIRFQEGDGRASPTVIVRGAPLPVEPGEAGAWLLNLHLANSPDRLRAEREILLRIGSIPLSLLMEETIALTPEDPGRCPLTGDMLAEVTQYIGAWGAMFFHSRINGSPFIAGQTGWTNDAIKAWLTAQASEAPVATTDSGLLSDALRGGLVFAYSGAGLRKSGLEGLLAPCPRSYEEIWIDGIAGFGVVVSLFSEPADPDRRQFATEAFVRLGRHLESASFSRGLMLAYNELESAQQRLVHTGKLAALGQMATGVAHELRQPITTINNFLTTIFDLVEKGKFDRIQQKVGEYRTRSERNIQRISRIIDHLRAFGHEGPAEFIPTPVETLLMEMDLALVQTRTERLQISFQWEIEPELPVLEMDRHQIGEVLMNLLSNARDAIEGMPEPEIRISANREGGYVRLAVTDNGTGIPEDVIEKVFDPFFTTKPVGEGTGIGLATAHGIVQSHGGRMAAENLPGGGARFSLWLPIEKIPDSAEAGTRAGPAAPEQRGAESALAKLFE